MNKLYYIKLTNDNQSINQSINQLVILYLYKERNFDLKVKRQFLHSLFG